MKKMSRFVSLALCGVLAVGMLAGCGGSSSSQSGSEGAASDGELKWVIGEIGPVTGAVAVYGQDVADAGKIAVDEINAAGGINGYQIEYVTADDEHDQEKAVNAYNSLKDKGMQILTGTVTSGPCTAVEAETAADNMFQLTPSGSSKDCIKEANAFAVCFNDPQQGTKSAEYIAEHLSDKTVATIYDSSDIYSSGIETNFEAKAKELGINVVSAAAYTQDSSTDFSAQLQAAKDGGADLIFLPIYYKDAATILTQANNMGYTPAWFGCDGMDGILGMEGFDASLAEGLMLLTPFAADATDELTVNFVTKFQEDYGRIPNQFGADEYDAMYALKAAIEKADLTPDMSISDICEALKVSITEIELEGLTGTITWASTGEPDKEPKAVVIQDGVYVSIED